MSVGRATSGGSVMADEQSGKPPSAAGVPVIDYEGSGYRQDFWEGQGREYEDAVERLALQELMPPAGGRIAEIGAGFGRLADLYRGYQQIVLFDYSRTLLADAVARWGQDERFVFVAGNVYQMPLANRVLDTLVMVRVMHHLADVPAALTQLQGLLHRSSTAVVEFANKRNLKAILRWGLRRQDWSPFDSSPLEFVALNFDFHPGWMAAQFERAGLQTERRLGVSHFRLPGLKRRVSAEALAGVDSRLFGLGGKYPLAPSVFVQASAPQAGQPADSSLAAEAVHQLFRCPACQEYPLRSVSEAEIACPACARTYKRMDGIWDFKLST